jgi:alpha-L-fucosidase
MVSRMQVGSFLLIGLLLAAPFGVNAQAPSRADSTRADRLSWFRDARLGIFIHWGIYAVDGIDESWSFFNKYVSYEDYMEQLGGFNAEKYDPGFWADLIRRSGARYAVLTAKHHDGVALWDTRESDLNVVDRTPAGRDLIAPFVESLRAQGLRVGLYFSHIDWSHPDYDVFRRDEYRYRDDPERWETFLRFHRAQVREITTGFEPDLLWFDGDWEHSAEEWRARDLRDSLLVWQPGVIVNSRISGYGDYATPEQGLPIAPPAGAWELCMTMNDSWGYQEHDQNYKTPYQIIGIFSDVLGMGGNLLLDIGPRADGTIPEKQVATLDVLGRWTDKHAEAIYGTVAGLPPGHFYGPTTLSEDLETLFLFLPHRPAGPVVVKGLKNEINRIRIVGNGTKLESKVIGKAYWSEVPGLLYIDVPEEELDEHMTVIALQLKGKVSLYREDGRTIEQN